jgi:hypothetical protein
MTNDHDADRKRRIVRVLRAYLAQRPGLSPADYGGGPDGWRTYRQEQADVSRARADFETLAAAVMCRPSITSQHLLDALRARRYTVTIGPELTAPDTVDYVTGQYFPTEYRHNACYALGDCLYRATVSTVEWDHPRRDKLRALALAELRGRIGRGRYARWVAR